MSQSENPLVTVITPTFNRAGFIANAVKSVQEQSCGDFEMLIVDDGSEDNTREILAPFLADPRLHYFYQSNQGQSAARNLGLSKARGEWVCFLDSDNAWVKEKLAVQLAAFHERPDLDVVYGDIILIDEAGNEVSRSNPRRYSGRIAYQMLKDNCVTMNTAMVRRRCLEAVGGFDRHYRIADDYDLWLKLSAHFEFYYLPRYLAYYRVMADQLSSSKMDRFVSNEAIITDFRRHNPELLSRSEFNRAFAFFYNRKARYLASIGRQRQALETLRLALRYAPLYNVVWRTFLAIVLKRSSR